MTVSLRTESCHFAINGLTIRVCGRMSAQHRTHRQLVRRVSGLADEAKPGQGLPGRAGVDGREALDARRQREQDRQRLVVCDGGDFVSYAGKYVNSYTPGCWLDPGPYGCLGAGLGGAIAARVTHPDRQVVALLGDGAAGFSLMDVDTLVRHELPVVLVVGNNGIWGLEKHPMRRLYGYDVAADLQSGCRYDEVVRALGGAGETVTAPKEIGPALDRAFASGVPYLANILTDPADAYPRSSNLG
jgi:acetolactate synthase I/II/III large subunit